MVLELHSELNTYQKVDKVNRNLISILAILLSFVNGWLVHLRRAGYV